MRESFTFQLNQLEQRLDAELRRAAITVRVISELLLDPDPDGAEKIGGEGSRMHTAARRIDSELVTITALQAPVATDLRRVMVMIEIAHHAELIANQFVLISEQLAELDSSVTDCGHCAEKLSEMATLASRQLEHAANAVSTRNLSLARRLDREDDGIDRRNRDVFRASAESESGPAERELGLRYMLIARSLERIGDNAVDIAEQAVFLVTAEVCEFSDASHPQAAA
jgi:phosphate transport system protein